MVWRQWWAFKKLSMPCGAKQKHTPSALCYTMFGSRCVAAAMQLRSAYRLFGSLAIGSTTVVCERSSRHRGNTHWKGSEQEGGRERIPRKARLVEERW